MYTLLNEPILCLHHHALVEPLTKIRLNVVSGQGGELGVFEHRSQVLQRTLVDRMGLRRAERGLEKFSR